MTIASPRVGNDAALLINYSGSYDTPAWVEVIGAGNVNISTLDVSMAEVVTRNGDWATNLAAKFRAEVEFQYLWGEDTAVLEALISSFWSRTPLDFAVMDADFTVTTNVGEGLRGYFFVASMPRNEPNEEAVMVDGFRIVPALKYADEGTYTQKINAQWYGSDGNYSAVGLRGPVPITFNVDELLKMARSNELSEEEVAKIVKNGRYYVDTLVTVTAKEAAAFYPDGNRIAALAEKQPLRPVTISKWLADGKINIKDVGPDDPAPQVNFYPHNEPLPPLPPLDA